MAENSAAGTLVGCLRGEDDDPGQVLSFFIVKSINKLFELFQDEQNNTCVRVRGRVSDTRFGRLSFRTELDSGESAVVRRKLKNTQQQNMSVVYRASLF